MGFRLATLLLSLLLVACTRAADSTVDTGAAKSLLVAYSHGPSDEQALTLTTGKEREFLQRIIDDRNAGKHGKAFAWRAKADSEVVVLESGPGFAVVQLSYRNSFSLKDEKMKFRLENVNGQWLIANHTDPQGVWWPDYLPG